MSLPYVKFETQEAINSKKDILGSEMNILKLTNKLVGYKKLRKLELIKKARLKTLVRQSSLKLGVLLTELPRVEGKVKMGKIELKNQDNKDRSIESELAEIKRKLNELN